MSKNTIYAGALQAHQQFAEGLTGTATILPGMILIEDGGELIPHNVEGQGGFVYVANVDSPAQGGVADLYAEGDTVRAFTPKSGDMFNLRIATGNNITAAGTPLTSNGAGALKIAATNGSEVVIAYADEVGNFTAVGGLLRCRVAQFGYNAVGGA